MAERVMEITLRVTVSDLSKAERKEAAKECGMRPSELPGVADIEASDIARLVESAVDADPEELFAGSDMFVTLKRVETVRYGWQGEGA